MKSDALNLRRNVRTSVISFAINLALIFVSYRFVILMGGLETLGIWTTLNAWIFLIRLGDVGMANATTRFVAACHNGADSTPIRRYIDTAIAMNALLFAALSIGGLELLTNQIPHILPTTSQPVALELLPIMFAAFFMLNLSGLMLGALQGLHLGYQSSWLSIVGTLVQLTLVLALVPRQGLVGLAWAQLGQHVVILVVGWVLVLRALGDRLRLPTHLSFETLREMIGFSLKAQVANLTNGFFEPLAKILIGRSVGLEILGLFEIAFKIVGLPRNAVVAGVQASAPAITRHMVDDLVIVRDLYKRSVGLVLKASGVVFAAVTMLAPAASWFLLGHIDLQLWTFVALLAVGFFFNTFGAPAYVLGIASGRMRGNILSGALSVVSMLAASTIGVKLGGAEGMVAGVAMGLALGGIFIKWQNERLLMEPT